MLRAVLNNQAGAAKDIVVLNAGAAIYAANLVSTLEAGVENAQKVIETGAALEKFNSLISYSKQIN